VWNNARTSPDLVPREQVRPRARPSSTVKNTTGARGLAKNRHRLVVASALVNLFRCRGACCACGRHSLSTDRAWRAGQLRGRRRDAVPCSLALSEAVVAVPVAVVMTCSDVLYRCFARKTRS